VVKQLWLGSIAFSFEVWYKVCLQLLKRNRYSRFQVDEVQSLSKISDFLKKSEICLCTSLTWKAL